MKYEVLIMGAGQKGALSDRHGTINENKYLSYAHAIKDNENFELIAFYDNDKIKQSYAENIWLKEIKPCMSPDVIVIATSDDQHYISLSQALMYNPKLVILEKPVPTNLEVAKHIGQEYKKRKIPILVDYTRRFIPLWQNIRMKILLGEYGDFKSGYLYYNRGLYHTASHFIDLCLFFDIDLTNIKLHSISESYRWVFDWSLFFEKDFINEHAIDIKQQKISMYDNHLKYVMDHAYDFLEGKCELLCTMDDGIKVIELLNKIKFKINKG